MSDRPQHDPEPEATSTLDADDVEGHGLPIILATNEMSRARSRSAKVQDEELPPLTKPFPRLRDDQKKR